MGRNISIQYMGKVEEKIYEGNVTVNDTSVAQYSSVEEQKLKTVTFFEYEYSPVYFYLYKDLVVKEIFPHTARVQGGTKIHVAGAWFKDMPWHGVFPHCKFGDKIVRGEFDSTVRIICMAPPGENIGDELPLEVSLNGVDFTKSGFKFYYYEQPFLERITPTSGKESGGTPIYIIGTNFT